MDIKKYLDDNNITYSIPKNGYLIMDKCVFCDGSKKLYINVENAERKVGFSKCFKCGFTGFFNKIAKEISGISDKEAYDMFNGEKLEKKEVVNEDIGKLFEGLDFSSDNGTDTTSRFEFVKNAAIIDIIKFDVYTKESIEEIQEGIEYLKRRGLSLEEQRKLEVVIYPSNYETLKKLYIENRTKEEKEFLFSGLRKTKLGAELFPQEQEIIENFKKLYNLTGRVLFPVKVSKKVIGYVARDYTGLSPVKVLNSTGPMSSDFFWNFNNVLKSKRLIIAEGIFSAITCGINRSVAVLGMNSALGHNKLRLLKSIDPVEFVVFFDPGAMEMASRLSAELAKGTSEVRIIVPPTIVKTKETLNLKDLSDSSVMVSDIEGEYNQYYLSYTDFNIIKMSAKATAALNSGNVIAEKKVFKIVETMFEAYPAKRKKFYLWHNKSKNNAKLEREFKKIADGNFLDANDLGSEYCDFLINTSLPYNHLIDYTIYDDQVIKRVQNTVNKIA